MTNEKMRAEFEAFCKTTNPAYKSSDDGVSNRRDWAIWQAATLKANQWRPIADAPLAEPVLMWNARANNTYGAGVHRVSTRLSENTTDCTHFMPLPLPPTGTEGNHD